MRVERSVRVRQRAVTAGRTRCSAKAIAACLLSVAGSLHAQSWPIRQERGSFTLGVFVTNPDTSARLDSDRGLGTEINLEDELGLQTRSTVARIGGYLWFGERHRLDLSLFEFARDATKLIDRTIEFGDRTFSLATTLESSSDVRVLKAAYTFVPLLRERGDLGIIAGVYTAKVDLALAEVGTASEASEDLTAPLPVIGIRGQYALTERIAVRGSIEVFSLNSGDTSGRLRDFQIGADYTFNRRVALGLAYNIVSMGIDAEERDGFEGALDWGYDGYLVYVKVDFGQ